MKQVIDIGNYLPKTIASREAIEILRGYSTITESNSYVFDFSNIEFISRAFADELLHFIEKKNITVSFVNTNSNVQQILKAVRKNRSKRKNSFHKIAVTEFTKKEDLSKFLSLI